MERYVRDFGPIYAETDTSRFPVEPWNAASTFIFLFIIYYYLKKTNGDHSQYPCTVLVLPLLFIGFLGGLIYHATRSHWIWLTMDFTPIFLLVLVAMYFFWLQITRKKLQALLLVCLLFFLTVFIRSRVSGSLSLQISVGYSLLAANIIIPAMLHAWKNNWRHIRFIVGALLLFSLAILFRYYDAGLSRSLFPMGTHFLWHVLGGGSVFLLLEYVYRTEKAGKNQNLYLSAFHSRIAHYCANCGMSHRASCK